MKVDLHKSKQPITHSTGSNHFHASSYMQNVENNKIQPPHKEHRYIDTAEIITNTRNKNSRIKYKSQIIIVRPTVRRGNHNEHEHTS